MAGFSGKLRISRGLLFFLLVALAVVVVVFRETEANPASPLTSDFEVFYYASHMLTDGARHALYDLSAQHVFQARFARPHAGLFYYPAAVLVPYLLLCWLPLLPAFAAWTALQLALLVADVRLLVRFAGVDHGDWPILLALAFAPTASSLILGQTSILILTLYVAVYALWRRGWRWAGGVVLGLATLKFQLIAGFVVVLLLRRKWREFGGACLGAAVIAVVSVLLTGVRALAAYPSLVRFGDSGFSSIPDKMACWRGLISLSGGHHLGWVVWLSALTIGWAAWTWTSLDVGFSVALLASMLVSFHFNPQDLCLFLIPFFLIRRARLLPGGWLSAAAFGAVLVSLLAGRITGALLTIPLAAMLVAVGWAGRSRQSEAAAAGRISATWGAAILGDVEY
ncbi:MAG: glycosyltransferase family 87 protein [Acidobacteriaceae bacterium]